jgi:hypothetical protein
MTQKVEPAPPKTTRRLGSSITARKTPPIWWAAVQLTALAFHIPLTVLTGSQSAIASKLSVVVIGGSVATVAVAAYLILSWKVIKAWRALAFMSVIVIVFWYWNDGEGVGPFSGPMATIVVYLLVAAAAVKYADRRLFKLVAFTASVALAGTLSILAVGDSLSAPQRSTGVQDPVQLGALSSRPDVVLIVLDGYGRSDVIREFYGYDNEPFLDSLRSQGFEVADRSVANYSITHLSIPALLNMSYMHPDGASIGNNDLRYLGQQISGGNTVVSFLKSNGYVYIHGESDHWYNVCGPQVDVCLSGPHPNITGHALLVRTPIGGLFYRTEGDPTTALNLRRVDELVNWTETAGQWPSGPKFVFLHIQLPHPPLYLDSECNVRIDQDLGGRILNNGEMTEDQMTRRRGAWVEQVQCANLAIEAFLAQVGSDPIVALVSDHGPDSMFTLENNPSDIDPKGLEERMASLTAVRLPEPCRGSLPRDVATVNLFRVIFSCMSGEDLEALDTRHFIAGFGGPIVEFELDTLISGNG